MDAVPAKLVQRVERASSEIGPGRRVVVLAARGVRADAEFVSALRELGHRAQIELVHDLAAARAALAGRVDAVVVDASLGAAVLDWVEGLRKQGGPQLVVTQRAAAPASGVLACLREQLAEQVAVVEPRPPAPEPALELPTRALLQHFASAVLVIDAGAAVGFANRAAEALLEAEPGTLLGMPLARALPGIGSEIASVISRAASLRDSERMLVREGGRRVPVSVSLEPLTREEGAAGGALLVLRELTELKQLQRQLLQSEKLASLGQLAAGVAHEINNPMGYIHANLSQLGEYLSDLERVWQSVAELRLAAGRSEPDAEELARASRALDALAAEVDADFLLRDLGKAIRESLEGSDRIRHIVKDLRTFSAPDTAERVHFDLNKALDSTAQMVATLMKQSVALTKQYAELPPLFGFPTQLKQVFMNLLVNAWQAIEERRKGEPGLRGEIRLRSELADAGVRVSVRDNGVGIAAETLPRIFDPFFTTKEVGVGTGLGLSTSHRIVQNHGGRLSAESQPGAGTGFTLWLPLEAKPEPSA